MAKIFLAPDANRRGAAGDPETQLTHIAEISQNARTTWFGLLGLLAFVGVTLMAHEDKDFFAEGVETQLPLIGISVPTLAFFIAAPLLVAAVYIYLHVYLTALWDALAEADKTIGGKPLAERIYPWLLSRAALHWRQMRRSDGCARAQSMRWTTIIVSLSITWGFGILAIARLWTDSWALHDPWLSLWIGALMLFSGWIGLCSFILVWRLMADTDRDAAHRRPFWFDASSVFALVFVVAASWYPTHGGRPWGPTANNAYTYAADLREVRLIERPGDWQPYDRWLEGFDERWRADNLTPGTELSVERYADYWSAARKEWRAELSAIDGASLHEADLRRADITRAFLPRADLRGARLDGADLAKAQLQRADLSPWDENEEDDDPGRFTSLRGADLRDTQMQGADLRQVRLDALPAGSDSYDDWLEGFARRYLSDREEGPADAKNAREWRDLPPGAMAGFWREATAALASAIEEADLPRADLRGAAMQGADLRGAEMHGADLSRAEMQGADLRGAEMQGAVLRLARMQGADLFEAEMQGADLGGAAMQGADLREARMQGADLRGARMQGADLGGAAMQGADLREARMQGAVLFGARMQGAVLFGARMQGAVLRRAEMQEAVLREARMQGADLFGARMQGADLFGARMQGADLRGARMQTAECAGVGFSASPAHSAKLNCNNLAQAQLASVIGDARTILPAGTAPDTDAPYHVLSCWTEPPETLEQMLDRVIESDPFLDVEDRERLRDSWLCDPGEEPRPTGSWPVDCAQGIHDWEGSAIGGGAPGECYLEITPERIAAGGVPGPTGD